MKEMRQNNYRGCLGVGIFFHTHVYFSVCFTIKVTFLIGTILPVLKYVFKKLLVLPAFLLLSVLWSNINMYLHFLLWDLFWNYQIMCYINSKSGAGLVAQWLSAHILLLSGPGFTGSDPGWGHGAACQKPCCGRHPRIKWRKMGMNVSSGPVFLSKKRRISSS